MYVCFSVCANLYEQACICCTELEKMDFKSSPEEMLNKILKNIYVGGCPHVIEILRNTDIKPEENFLKSIVLHPESDDDLKAEKELVQLKSPRSYPSRTYISYFRLYDPRKEYMDGSNSSQYNNFTFCGTTLQHMAIGLGKYEAVKYLINTGFKSRSDMGEFVGDPDNIYLSAEAKTEFYWLSVYHLALKFQFEELLYLRLDHPYCRETFFGCDDRRFWQGIVTNYAVDIENGTALQQLLSIAKDSNVAMPWKALNLKSYALCQAFYNLNKKMVKQLTDDGAVFVNVKDQRFPEDCRLVEECLPDKYCIKHDCFRHCYQHNSRNHCRLIDMAIQRVTELGDLKIFQMLIACKGFKDFLELCMFYTVKHSKYYPFTFG